MNIDLERAEDDVADMQRGRPTVDDVYQQNFTHPAVPVRAAEPFQVQQLPTIAGQARNLILGDNTTVFKLLNEDPRRSRAQVWSAGQAVYIGTDKASVEKGVTALLAADQWPPLEVHSTETWYVRAAVANATVSVINEQWAQ